MIRPMTQSPQDLFAAAVAAHQAGGLADADALYSAVLRLAPAHAPSLNNRGDVRNRQGRFAEALADLDRALALAPDDAAAHNNRGVALRGLQRRDEARAAFTAALAHNPALVDARLNLANTHLDARDHAGARAILDGILAEQPDHLTARFNRAKVLTEAGAFDAAVEDYDAVIAAGRSHASEATLAKGLIRLRQGDFAAGWPLYEARWSADAVPRHDQVPVWRGEDIAGKTILIHGEQGFGDTIQFARYIPRVRARAARVHVVLQQDLEKALAPVLRGCTVHHPGASLPAFDTYSLLMSLPLAFGTRLDTIPADIPYVVAPPALAPASPGRPRIGLAWAGRPTHVNDRNRSLALAALAPLLGADAEFHALQKDIPGHDRAALARLNVVTHELGDFFDTARLIAAMDMVVSVDTAVAHLAGAMAKPVHILLPFTADFRWLLGRSDSPWYPTARLYRQHRPGDWSRAVDDVAAAIKNPGGQGLRG